MESFLEGETVVLKEGMKDGYSVGKFVDCRLGSSVGVVLGEKVGKKVCSKDGDSVG